MSSPRIAVVIPCYKVKDQILDVLSELEPVVCNVYVVDDDCPQKTGDFVEQNCQDPRVKVLRNPKNLGVGGATVRGYRAALEGGASIVVKVDGDGQMRGASIVRLTRPIVAGYADYAKGNRFWDLSFVRPMPLIRLIGNSCLSFISKLSTGYWNIMDPTNGFTAIHSKVLQSLDLDRLERRYFFESDLLYRLYLHRAVVWDVPMQARYRNERSNLSVLSALFEFGYKHFLRLLARIFYCYFLRDFQLGSVMLLAGIALSTFGCTFGTYHWYWGHQQHVLTPLGTIMLAALPCLVGLQLMLTFLNCDLNNVPNRVVYPLLELDVAGDVQGSQAEACRT